MKRILYIIILVTAFQYLKAQNIESRQADIIAYDCNSVFWTINGTGIIKQWDLNGTTVTGGDIVLTADGYSGLAFGEVNNTGVFYVSKNGSYQKYNFSSGWTTPVSTSLYFANNGAFQDQLYLMEYTGIPSLYYDDGATINQVAQLGSSIVVADVAVDSHGKAYVVIKNDLGNFELKVFDSTGLIQTISMTVPTGYSFVCAYGMFFIGDTLYIAKSTCATSDPNTLMPVIIDDNTAQFGSPIPFPCDVCYDAASCNKHIMGVDSFTKNPLTLYPNPSENLVNINFDGTVDRLEVYSIDGRLVHTNSSTNQIDVSDFKCGVYYVVLKSGGKTLTARLIRN